MKRLICDCDGVILDYKNAFIHFCKQKDIQLNEKGNLFEHIIGDYGKTINLVNEFNNSDEFGKLKAFDDSKEYLNKLAQEGWILTVLSSCGASPKIKKARIDNLLKEVGDVFSRVDTINYFDSKDNYLKEYSTSWFIDDCKKNALMGFNTGHNTIHFKRDKDLDFKHDKIYNAYHFSEVYNLLNNTK